MELDGIRLACRGRRIVVPISMTEILLDRFHGPSTASGSTEHETLSHLSGGQLFSSLARWVWWESMQEDCTRRTRECPQCQLADLPVALPRVGALHPTLAPGPLHTLYMDFFGPLQPSVPDNGSGIAQQYIVAGIDAFSRTVLLVGCSAATGDAAEGLLRLWTLRYCAPQIVRTDRGSHFTGKAFRAACEKAGAKLVLGVPYHHSGQGMIERVLRGVLRSLIATSFPAADRWAKADRLALMTAVINTTPNGVTGMSPFAVLHGFEPRVGIAAALRLPLPTFESIASFHRELLALQERVLVASALGQMANKGVHDRAFRAAPQYKVGEFVMVLAERRPHKLAPTGRGPYRVAAALPGEMYRVHRVLAEREEITVHVRRLVRFEMALTTEHAEALREFQGGAAEGSGDWGIVSAIVGHRQRSDGRWEFRVHWAGSGDATWVHGRNLRRNELLAEYVRGRRNGFETSLTQAVRE